MAVRRVVVTGGECTGKTTLARELAARFGTSWAQEAARRVAEEKNGPLGPEDVEPIAREHLRIADDAALAAAAAGSSLVILDQDLLSTVVYARHYYGSCPEWIERLASERLADLYLLCLPDLPWASDGVRDRPHARMEMHHVFEATLREAGARIVEVRGTGPEREELAAAAVERVRRAP